MPYRAERYYCALLLLIVLWGCQKKPPKSIDDFELGLTRGVFTHDLVIRNKSAQTLTAINMTVTIYTETDTKQFKRNWGYWEKDDVKTINFPNTGGSVQGYVLTGTAMLGEEPVNIRGDFLMKN